jgi:hypothetical protein
MKRATTAMACAGLAIACVLGAGGPAAAQPAPSPHALELAKRYIAAVHMEATIGSMMTSLMPAMFDSIAKRNGLAPNPEMRTAMTEAASESTRAMMPKMEDAMAPVIAGSFSEPELEAAVAYYESAPGQSLMAKMPAYMAKATPPLVALMPAMQADMEARFCRKVGCPAASRP